MARPAPRPRRIVLLIVGAVLVTLVVCAVVGWRLAQLRPAWWPPPPDLEAANRVGQQLENAVSATLTDQRPPDDTWSLVIRQDHANAWLAGRMPKWLANRSVRVPDRYLGAAVSFERGTMHLTVELARGTGPESPSRWLGIAVAPSIEPPGDEIALRPVGARIGQLRMPFGAIAGRDLAKRLGLRDDPGRAIQSAAFRAVVTGEPMRIPAVFRLDDGRRVRVLGVAVDSGALTLTCRTER